MTGGAYSSGTGPGRGVDWRAHVAMARPDYWFKNVFVLPGVVVALGTVDGVDAWALLRRAALGLLAICLVASSNYTLNEILDAPTDRHHPGKRARPVPSGRVRIPAAWRQWAILFIAGLLLGLRLSGLFAMSLVMLWVMACVYNIPPVRSKDQPYVDVLSEAINNPIRMVAGWYIVTTDTHAPASLLLSYWMIGCYFMALKRYAELAGFGADRAGAAAYRRSFATYTTDRLLVAVMFYAAAAMLFFGAFCMRYRLELILSFPVVALVMALYLRVALKPASAAQQPERLYRERGLMTAVVLAAAVMIVLLRVDLPGMHRFVTPTAPAQYGPGVR